MSEFFSNLEFRDFLKSLALGELNLATDFAWLVIVTLLSMVGGAIGGMLLAGKDIGYGFSATLGSLFAPAGAIPAVFFGLVILNLFAKY